MSRRISRQAARRLLTLLLACVVLAPLAHPLGMISAQTSDSNSIVPTSPDIDPCKRASETSTADTRYVVSVEELNLRSGPSTSCDIVAELKRDAQLTLAGEVIEAGDQTWVPVSTAGGDGFVVLSGIQEVPEGASCGNSAEFDQAGEDGFTADVVNLRSGPGLGCAIVTQLNSGTPASVRGVAVEHDGEIWLPVSTPLGNGYIVQEGYAPPGSWEQPVAVAVLMYHDINDNYNRFVVAPWQLEQQLIWLRDNGYTSITPRDLIANLDHGAPLPPRPVILSVDDGWASARIFRDLLTAYGFEGTYMLPNYAELTPEEIYELNQIGEVCGHSVSHPFLDQLELRRPVVRNRREQGMARFDHRELDHLFCLSLRRIQRHRRPRS